MALNSGSNLEQFTSSYSYYLILKSNIYFESKEKFPHQYLWEPLVSIQRNTRTLPHSCQTIYKYIERNENNIYRCICNWLTTCGIAYRSIAEIFQISTAKLILLYYHFSRGTYKGFTHRHLIAVFTVFMMYFFFLSSTLVSFHFFIVFFLGVLFIIICSFVTDCCCCLTIFFSVCVFAVSATMKSSGF